MTIKHHPVDLLILGAGWTSSFLIPLLKTTATTFAATTTTGHSVADTPTIPFKFDPDSPSLAPYRALPAARTVLITFPLKGEGQSRHLTSLYLTAVHPVTPPHWIQLGSTGIFAAPHWNDDTSRYDTSNARAVAEDELLRSCGVPSAVLNLAGLYGGARDPRTWVTRVAKSKAEVAAKKALHLVHGADVARAILGAHRNFEKVRGRRWIMNDLRVYDWWDLIQDWGGAAEENAVETLGKEGAEEGLHYRQWIRELMREEGVRALPRGAEGLGRVLDGRAFWEAIGDAPVMGRVG